MIASIIEIWATVALLIGILNEEKLARWERRTARKIMRRFAAWLGGAGK